MGTGRKAGKKKRNRRFQRFLKLQILMQLLVIVALAYYFNKDTIWYYIDTVKGLYEEALTLTADVSANDFGAGEPSVAYAQDGTVITTWRGDKNVHYVPISDMPQAVIDAMVCMEDKNFYKHHGVDYKALLRAFYALLRHKGEVTQGGSTITMQLARGQYLTQEVTWQRKVKEIFISWELEKKFTKEQILEFYLNTIYFGNGYNGIGSASMGYFGKEVSELDLSQLVYLCAIPNNPTRYNPVTNGENTEKRKVRILNRMMEEGYITEEECLAAVSAATVLEAPEPIEKKDYVETFTTYCAVRTLMELSGFEFRWYFQNDEERKAYEAEYASRYAACLELLSVAGYRIYTSFDLEMQQQLQDSLDQELIDFTEMDERGVYTLQGASVCLDNSTGYVKAIVGGRSQNFDFYPLNRGYQSFRQPGSSIKPLIVYTPSFERGYTPDTMVVDAPITDGPRNATGYYEGVVTVRYAVEQSLNTIAWKLFEELTPQEGLSYLTEMEFANIVEKDYGLPAALGGFTLGVSPLEMASAFAAIENDGVFRRPTCITRIEDAEGEAVYISDSPGKAVYTKEAADVMEEVLVSVMENGTGKPVQLTDRFCAGKTGTTNECKDSWFVGYTEHYTTSVWVGYDMPREMVGITGPSYSGFIWKDFMEKIH